jgi:hypothetical protein
MGEHEILGNYLNDLSLDCISNKAYEKKSTGYMLGCAKKLWFQNDLNVRAIPEQTLESQLEEALTPSVDRHDVTIIDFLENAKSQSNYYDY